VENEEKIRANNEITRNNRKIKLNEEEINRLTTFLNEYSKDVPLPVRTGLIAFIVLSAAAFFSTVCLYDIGCISSLLYLIPAELGAYILSIGAGVAGYKYEENIKLDIELLKDENEDYSNINKYLELALNKDKESIISEEENKEKEEFLKSFLNPFEDFYEEVNIPTKSNPKILRMKPRNRK